MDFIEERNETNPSFCPNCGSKDYHTFDSRKYKPHIHRRRVCYKCGTRWSSIEILADYYNKIIAENLAMKNKLKSVGVILEEYAEMYGRE